MSNIAERNIIGALILDSREIKNVTDTLQADMFNNALLGRMYLEYQRAYDRGIEINIALLIQNIACEEYPRDELMEIIKNITLDTTTRASIKSYAQVVVDEYKAKKLDEMLANQKITASNYKNVMSEIKTNIESLQGMVVEAPISLNNVVEQYKGNYFTMKEKSGLNFGFTQLDDILGDLEGGDVVVIGARPAVGKSAFVTQITSHLGKQGKRVGFFNLEMKEKQVYERFVVNESGISLTRLKRATNFLGDEKERFDKANEIISKQDCIYINTGSKKVTDIRTQSQHMNYDVIIIDYLQLLRTDSVYKGNRAAEVGDISKTIKAIATDFNIPVIVLSQLNRVSEMKSTKEPTMNELRESGDIEQDASIIILLWNLDNEGKKKGLKVDKNRQGKTGKLVFNFNGELMRFEETTEKVDVAIKLNNSENPFEV